jgi:hypothetical protein
LNIRSGVRGQNVATNKGGRENLRIRSQASSIDRPFDANHKLVDLIQIANMGAANHAARRIAARDYEQGAGIRIEP